jgi:hypothetical protein
MENFPTIPRVHHSLTTARSAGEKFQRHPAVAAHVGEDVHVSGTAGAGSNAALEKVVVVAAEEPGYSALRVVGT